MKILAIETSCDDTSCAVITEKKEILSNIIQSQVQVHEKYLGVVPELASRHHLENINSIIDIALKEADLTLNDIDVFAVTRGPGLAGSLLVGVMSAKTLAYVYNKPLVPVNHLKAHIWANFLQDKENRFIPEFPAIVLLVSGGHTELCLMKDYDDISVLGRTRDDACGEAFDKVAKILNLGFPGGPIIDKLSKDENERVKMPIPLLPKTFDFSFSGLKTAVLYMSKKEKKLDKKKKIIISASFQDSAVHVLVKKVIDSAKKYNAKTIMLSGGVAANSLLRQKITEQASKLNKIVHYPSISLCTDNAAMVGSIAVHEIEKNGLKYFMQTKENIDQYKVDPNMGINN